MNFFHRLLLCGLLLLQIATAGDFQKVRVFIANQDDIKTIVQMEIDLEGSNFKENTFLDLQISLDEKSQIESAGFQTEVLIDDLTAHYQSRLEQRAGEGFGYGSMGGYYTFSEVMSQLDSMIHSYPTLISQKDTIGYSIQGRPLVAVKISDNPEMQETEPEVLFTGLHHAREPGGMMTILYYMWHLLENHGIDDQATYLVDNRQIWFVPVVNPDGYEHNYQTDPNGGGMWRKNARDNNDNGVYFESADGVDLNRNYGYQWGYDNNGSSPTPSSNTYRGPFGFSEVETQIMRDFCNQHNFLTAFNYHTYSNLLIHPWAYLDSPTPDHHIFQALGQEMISINGYTLGTPGATVGYQVNGDSNDWMYGEQVSKPKIFAYTPEVGSSSDGFWPPTNRILPLAQENLYANIVLTLSAGSFPKLYGQDLMVYGQNQYIDPGETFDIYPKITNFGISNSGPVSLQIIERTASCQILNPEVIFSGVASFDSATAQTPWKIQVDYNTPLGTTLEFVAFTRENGSVISQDTLTFDVGTPIVAFQDDLENGLTNWTANNSWNLTTSQSHSANHSLTESPSGVYANNADAWTKVSNVDLTGVSNAYLQFWTRWEIEDNWDFGMVEISANNGATWSNLRGQYMAQASGQGVQTLGLYGYEGTQSGWVRESISLAAFAGQTVQLRFHFASDGWIQKDGWYVDDIEIVMLDPNANVPPYIKSATNLGNQVFTGQPYPVQATVLDDQNISHASLFYKPSVSSSFTEVAMARQDSIFSANIPALSAGQSVDYYIQAWDAQNLTATAPVNAPAGYFSLNIQNSSGPLLSVSPAAITLNVPQSLWAEERLALKNEGDQTLTFDITDAEVTVNRAGAGATPVPAYARALVSNYKKWLNPNTLGRPAPIEPNLTPDGITQIIISDSTGDVALPGIDILSVDYGTSFLNYTFEINFADIPDPNSILVLMMDTDQNFGTGIFPPPFGIGLGAFDVGADYQIVFDFANLIGDTLGLPPSVYALNMGDSIPTPAGIPFPIVINGNTAKADFFKILYPFFNDNMNISLLNVHLGAQSLPDLAPDFGHGLIGNPLGNSWITTLDTLGNSAYPFSGSIQPGDSLLLDVKVSAAYPQGGYGGKLVIANNGGNGTLEVPVTMNVQAPGQAAIAVNPAAIIDTLEVGGVPKIYPLAISNNGSGVLVYIISDSLQNGHNWLRLGTPYGTVNPGETGYQQVTILPDSMPSAGLHETMLRILSTDEQQLMVEIPVRILLQPGVGISQNNFMPTEFKLYKNYPNPFNPGTTISFDLPEMSKVTVAVYNILGQKIATLVNGALSAGSHKLYWDGKNGGGVAQSSGIYFYKIQTEKHSAIQKMLLTK